MIEAANSEPRLCGSRLHHAFVSITERKTLQEQCFAHVLNGCFEFLFVKFSVKLLLDYLMSHKNNCNVTGLIMLLLLVLKA